jgi:putative intracellular protease/amidase
MYCLAKTPDTELADLFRMLAAAAEGVTTVAAAAAAAAASGEVLLSVPLCQAPLDICNPGLGDSVVSRMYCLAKGADTTVAAT